MRWLMFVCPGIALALSAAFLEAGETVSHPQLRFQLSVPEGFVRDVLREQGDTVCAFQRAPGGDQKVGTFIVISRLGGVLGREKIDPEEVAAMNPQIILSTERWQGFEIDVFRVPKQAEGLQLLTFNAQVPLRPEAVQVSVVGEADRENELRGVLQSVLSNLDGQTNWLSTGQRIGRLAEGIVGFAITVGLVVMIAAAVGRALRRGRRARDQAEPGAAPDHGGH